MKCSADLKGKRASRVSFFLAWLWCLGLGWVLPLSVWADDADLGRDLYHELCAGCHGKDMLKPGLAFDLKTFPANDYSRFENVILTSADRATNLNFDWTSLESYLER